MTAEPDLLQELLRLRSQIAASAVELALIRLGRALKAGYDPNQPRDELGRWTDGGGALEPEPEIPENKPPTPQLRNRVIKAAARWLARAALRQAIGPIGTFLTLLEATAWLYEYYPYIESYRDAPKSLEELQWAVLDPQRGYDTHHIVEQTPAERDGYSRLQIDALENLVRIPTLKHWEINGWYGTPNDDYGRLSPREYLRDKDWSERTRVGLRALIHHEVLKP